MSQSEFISAAIDAGYNHLTQTIEQMIGRHSRPSIGAMMKDVPLRTLRNVIQALYPHTRPVQTAATIEAPIKTGILGYRTFFISAIILNEQVIGFPHGLPLKNGVTAHRFEAQGHQHTLVVTIDDKVGHVGSTLTSIDLETGQRANHFAYQFKLYGRIHNLNSKKPVSFTIGWMN